MGSSTHVAPEVLGMYHLGSLCHPRDAKQCRLFNPLTNSLEQKNSLDHVSKGPKPQNIS